MTLTMIGQGVLDAQACIKKAAEQRWEEERAARKREAEATRMADDYLEQLRLTHKGRAVELAEEAGECPRQRWGGFMEPSEVTVTPEGLMLSWDINGDYAPAYCLVTWEQLVSLKGEVVYA